MDQEIKALRLRVQQLKEIIISQTKALLLLQKQNFILRGLRVDVPQPSRTDQLRKKDEAILGLIKQLSALKLENERLKKEDSRTLIKGEVDKAEIRWLAVQNVKLLQAKRILQGELQRNKTGRMVPKQKVPTPKSKPKIRTPKKWSEQEKALTFFNNFSTK